MRHRIKYQAEGIYKCSNKTSTAVMADKVFNKTSLMKKYECSLEGLESYCRLDWGCVLFPDRRVLGVLATL
jgi:hypothetical protein